ncbi:MAE_28990/MAE_18760 family HEPN-like nuclease [Tenacibaculum sp. 1_MG-2023]|uniref:MAE_28990/MAE_18760 family HEPN-like nuclease n=1 Tax=Tenacibaculum sp. 1_MG-2023 TaxID=3062653 RepID=UPI0026E44525|nr:MAE_28990/MAE_18760 family HEPN-like nuclease [Tenacibaculum sp. 1_MG-2023]MDO6676387.1 MAE_28990/MAE_18760 family HEPN-like nuclease [Tenacibaculum sp. 1_MG-2023]
MIGSDYAWRRKELKLIKDQIPSNPSPKQNASLRFSVPILYAHWEGFVKNSCELYLEFVAKKHLKHNELKPQFVALSLSKKLGDLDIKHIEQKTKAVEFLISEIDKNSNMQTKNVIQTKSNLRYSVFEEILFVIGIDESKFSHKKSLINDLVDSRNHIAHGEYLRVEYDAYHLMHDDVQVLMEQLKTEIENIATLEEYKLKKVSA